MATTNNSSAFDLATTLIVLATLFGGVCVKGAQDDFMSKPDKTRSHTIGYVHVLNDAVNKARQTRHLTDSSKTSKLADVVSVLTDYEKLLGGNDMTVNINGNILDVESEPFKTASHDRNLTSTSNVISPQCKIDARRILKEIGASWTISFIDSTGKPGPGLAELHLNFVGEYEECRSGSAPAGNETWSPGFKGNYCVLKAMPLFLTGFNFIQWGVCVPDSCSSKDLDILFTKVINDANLTTTVSQLPTQCRSEERNFTVATYAAIVILSIIGLLMVLGTFYDIVTVQSPQWMVGSHHGDQDLNWTVKNGQHKDHGLIHNGVTLKNSETQQLLPKSKQPNRGTCCKVLVAFSVYTNGAKVLNTTQSSDSLEAAHGIRFISMSWIVLVHVGFTTGTLANPDKVEDYFHRWTYAVVANGYPSVDTFFTLSGLLVSYLTIKQMRSKGLKINWPMFYFHRFWRLTPPYMLVLLTVLGLQQFMGSGAMWDNVQPLDKIACEKNWWTNLLYINNIVNPGEMCLGQSWYLANDMQFYILSPLMIIPFYFHRMAGIASCMVFLLITTVTTGTLSYQNGWPISPKTDSQDLLSSQNFFVHNFYVPWCRIGPYVIGLMAGYLLAETRGGKDITMRKSTVFFGWVIAIATALAVVYGAVGDYSGEDTASVEVAALYNALNRSAWGVSVAWVIVACAAGYGGPVNAFLSWSPFVVLGRLTYMTYLLHLNIIYSYFMNIEVPFYITDASFAISYLGILVFVLMAAFVLMLAFESPMVALEKVFLDRDGKR